MISKLPFLFLLAVLAAGCASTAVAPGLTPAGEATASGAMPTVTRAVSATPRPMLTRTPAPTLTPTAALVPSGPEDYPPEVNPLSGLPVAHPENLLLPPALVSTTNFPVTARPQAGLSFSPLVFELYIGEGATRFLALYYGEYPTLGANAQEPAETVVGPVRSGRLPYESLRLLYKGFMVIASASTRVLPHLSEYFIVQNSDQEDVNRALLPVSELQQLAVDFKERLGTPHLLGLRFDPQPPAGGEKGQRIWLPFHLTNQVIWRYDEVSHSYLRYQDDGTGKNFTQMIDRLNGEPLAFENVVILFAPHHYYDETLFNIDLMYITRLPALLFRDGRVYSVYWTTGNQEYEHTTGRLRPIRFVDAEGQPFPLRPGQTWVELVPQYAAYNETLDSENYKTLMGKPQPGSGNWAVHFYVPEFEPTPEWLGE